MRCPAVVASLAAVALAAGCFQAPPPPPMAQPRPSSAPIALADDESEQTAPELAAALRSDPDAIARREAVYRYADSGAGADALVIGEALKDPDVGVRIAALEALSMLDGVHSRPLIASALDDRERRVRIAAVHALLEISDPAAGIALRQALADPDPAVRATAEAVFED